MILSFIMRNLNLILLTLGLFVCGHVFSQSTLVKIPTRCDDTLNEEVSKCSVKVVCNDEPAKIKVTLTYSCSGSPKKFETTVEGMLTRTPSGLLTKKGLYITSPLPGTPLVLVSKSTMQSSTVATPSKDSFFFFNHDQTLLELKDTACGTSAFSIKGKCYQMKERPALISE